MNLTEFRSSLRVDLKDPGGEGKLWTNDELNRCVNKSMSDLSRFLPLEKIYEVTLGFTVTDEEWTAGASAGTWVTLANKPIKYDSETVKDADSVACVRDTDYYMNYGAGKITHIADSKIANLEACTISYTKSEIALDISSLTDLIRISRVEYPVGNVPQSFVSFNVVEDLLSVAGATESQVRLTSGKHIAIHYKAMHTEPEIAVDSSCPSFLNNTVILAASAYALLIKALYYEQQVASDIALSKGELDNVSHTDTSDALDKINTYAVGASAPSVKKYLSDGVSKINAINVGDNVPENYAAYAGMSRDIASLFINEAVQRNAINNHYIAGAANYVATANQLTALAETLRTEAAERRNEAWSIWMDKKQFVGSFVMTPPAQPVK